MEISLSGHILELRDLIDLHKIEIEGAAKVDKICLTQEKYIVHFVLSGF